MLLLGFDGDPFDSQKSRVLIDRPVFLLITSEFRVNSAWQKAKSLLFGPEKKIRPVRTEDATLSDCSSQLDNLGLESPWLGVLSARLTLTPRLRLPCLLPERCPPAVPAGWAETP